MEITETIQENSYGNIGMYCGNYSEMTWAVNQADGFPCLVLVESSGEQPRANHPRIKFVADKKVKSPAEASDSILIPLMICDEPYIPDSHKHIKHNLTKEDLDKLKTWVVKNKELLLDVGEGNIGFCGFLKELGFLNHDEYKRPQNKMQIKSMRDEMAKTAVQTSPKPTSETLNSRIYDRNELIMTKEYLVASILHNVNMALMELAAYASAIVPLEGIKVKPSKSSSEAAFRVQAVEGFRKKAFEDFLRLSQTPGEIDADEIKIDVKAASNNVDTANCYAASFLRHKDDKEHPEWTALFNDFFDKYKAMFRWVDQIIDKLGKIVDVSPIVSKIEESPIKEQIFKPMAESLNKCMNATESEIAKVISDSIKSLVSEWVFGQIRISYRFGSDCISAAITDTKTEIPIALLKFILEATEIKAEIHGFDVKVNAASSSGIEGGEVNTVMILMNKDKIKDALQKALSGLTLKETEPEAAPAVQMMTPLTKAIYDAIGYPPGLREGMDLPPEPQYAEVRNVEGKAESKPGISHAPQRTHDQEKNYSPALKRTGGYIYKPQALANKPKPHVYNPNVEYPVDLDAKAPPEDDEPEAEEKPENKPETTTEPNNDSKKKQEQSKICSNRNDNKRYVVQNIPPEGINDQNIAKVIVKPFGSNVSITDIGKKTEILRGCNLIRR